MINARTSKQFSDKAKYMKDLGDNQTGGDLLSTQPDINSNMIGGQSLFPVVKQLQVSDFENFLQKRNDDMQTGKDYTHQGPPSVDQIEVAIHENIQLAPSKPVKICLAVEGQ